MQIIFDAHVHIYPCYDLSRFLQIAFSNLINLSKNLNDKNIAYALCLTERRDCFAFDALKNKKLPLNGFSVNSCSEENVIEIVSPSGKSLFLFAGRQIITAERLEVLSLLSNHFIEEGKDVYTTINQIKSYQGIPVLNWAPGKWMFKRSVIVKEILTKYSPGELLIGDTSLRPDLAEGIFMPPMMKAFKFKGFQFIYGSDPLPFPEEELMVGTYLSYFSEGFEINYPETSLKKLLMQAQTNNSPMGKRSLVMQLINRLVKNQKVRI